MAEDPRYSGLERRVNFLEQQVNRLTREQIISAELQALGSSIEARFQAFESTVEARFDALGARVENRFTVLSNQIGELTVRSYDVSVKLGSLENMVSATLGLVRELNERVGTTETRVDGLVTRTQGVETRLGAVERILERIYTRLEGMESRGSGSLSGPGS